MPAKAKVNEAYLREAEKRGEKYVPTTARDFLRGHTALVTIGRFGATPPPSPPPSVSEFKDARAGI